MKPGKYEAMWLLNGCIVERVSAWGYSNMRAQGDQVGFSSEWGTDRVSHMEAPNLNDWKDILFFGHNLFGYGPIFKIQNSCGSSLQWLSVDIQLILIRTSFAHEKSYAKKHTIWLQKFQN